jgi:hypothetical protein
MNLRHQQRGLGWFGMLVLFSALGFIVIVVMTCLPIYLNQMKIKEAVHAVASGDDKSGNDSISSIRSGLQRYWDINSIDGLEPKDVVVRRTEQGRFLHYDYEARGHLFYNIYVVIDFSEDVPISGVSVE